jgi:hypothetical protein
MATLQSAGYSVLVPEGTSYLWSKWASSDPQRQWNALADQDVFVLPSSMMNAPCGLARWWVQRRRRLDGVGTAKVRAFGHPERISEPGCLCRPRRNAAPLLPDQVQQTAAAPCTATERQDNEVAVDQSLFATKSVADFKCDTRSATKPEGMRPSRRKVYYPTARERATIIYSDAPYSVATPRCALMAMSANGPKADMLSPATDVRFRG